MVFCNIVTDDKMAAITSKVRVSAASSERPAGGISALSHITLRYGHAVRDSITRVQNHAIACGKA